LCGLPIDLSIFVFVRYLFLFCLSAFLLPFVGFSEEIIPLHSNWKFKNANSQEYKNAKVPGVVHLDLLENQIIQDPYFGNNELKQRWIEEMDWDYATSFLVDSNLFNKNHIELVFEGLDTYATIFLNGKEIQFSDNMFRTWRIDVKSNLILGLNELRVRFHSPITMNKKNVTKSPYILPAANETVDLKVSPYTRKAAYHFGWDWGPRFVTCGIWRPVYLRTWDDARLADFSYQTDIQENGTAKVDFKFEILSHQDQEINFQFNQSQRKIRLKKGVNIIQDSQEFENAKLWYPKGYGDQHFYEAFLVLSNGPTPLLQKKLKFALRSIQLIQQPDEIGTPFYFVVNDQPFFAKGANYIPQDLFLPRVDSARYEKLINQALAANINFLRVWGGGIYENDYFYELCDKNGILVWQDFMFANSMYPSDPSFISTIDKEVQDNIKRLRNHPCIALWCGNNEIEVAWKNWGWQKQFNYSPADSTEIWNTYKSIFHELIPQNLRSLDPQRAYVSTSPLSNWGTPENFNHGSMHYWGVWHGTDSIENYATNVGRFMAEYGYQSYPNYATLALNMDSTDLILNSEIMRNRQKSYVGNSIIEANIIKYTYPESNFEKWIQLSQLVQAHALGLAIRQHRIQAPHCMGTVFWQLNDCWPGPSWSIIDYYGNEKQAYQEVQNYYQPIIASSTLIKNVLHITFQSDFVSSQQIDIQVSVIHSPTTKTMLMQDTMTLNFLTPKKIQITLPKKLMKKNHLRSPSDYFKIELKNMATSQIQVVYFYPKFQSTVDFPNE
jgi:beta-mannosidase